jgi:hypothetical protein
MQSVFGELILPFLTPLPSRHFKNLTPIKKEAEQGN